MKITSPKLNTSHLTANEEALLRCQTALELKDKGDYIGAQGVMFRLWKRIGDRPDTKGLHASVAAEVVICVGILTRWIGSKNRVEQAQEAAKNLITEGITYYESIADTKKVAAARVELACCYWRQGALDEARITLTSALDKLTTEGETRARALLRLAIIEWSASRYGEALTILKENSFLFKKIANHAIKGAYHSQLAMVLQELTPPHKTPEHFKQVFSEYETADRYFRMARNNVFRADVRNNIANICREIGRHKEAHKQLEHARRLRATVKDKIGIAQIDDTRAQVFIAEKKFKNAETVAAGAVRILEKSGHQCLLADALITHSIALARLKQTERARFTFQRAIEVAHQVGALNKAGLAALTMIEELDGLPPEHLNAAYDRASEWLAKTQSPDLLMRLNAAARKVVGTLRSEMTPEEATEAILNKPRDLQGEVLKHEANLVRQALAKANGSVTRAASLLSMSYQALAYVIQSRHPDLLKERSPIRRRARKDHDKTQEPKKPLNT